MLAPASTVQWHRIMLGRPEPHEELSVGIRNDRKSKGKAQQLLSSLGWGMGTITHLRIEIRFRTISLGVHR